MRRLIKFVWFLLTVIHLSTAHAQKPSRPNIVVILVDDMGFSDLGCYGSEIATPNIDKLASQGFRFTNFYNTGRCCPTRASLMTGLYPHQTGLGWMDGVDQKVPGYKGEINNPCVTIPEVLKPAGYSTYMSGKWHVVAHAKDTLPQYNWPLQRGFDRFFGILTGAANYFAPTNLISGNKGIKPGKDFYMTDALTDTALKYIDEHVAKKTNDPFFLYLAFNAPHFPIQAKEDDINKYLPVYTVGWDKIRERRFSKQQQLGLFDASVKLSERDSEVPAWELIPEAERPIWVKRMAVYAGAIDCIDQGVGRLTETLKRNKVYDNTLIVFMSDNGGCAEHISNKDKSIEALGGASSNESYRINWANASNTPFRLFKSRVHEGGIHTPFIVHWPQKTKEGGYVHTPSHIIDLMPTFLEVSGAAYPTEYKGQKIPSYEGRSLASLFMGQTVFEQRPLFWEHEANRAVRVNQWKLVSKSAETAPYIGPWELYNVETDKTETINLAASYPEKVKELEHLWNKWAAEKNVFPLDGRLIKKQRAKEFPKQY
jgi:arylsulfatase A-like enzyme